METATVNSASSNVKGLNSIGGLSAIVLGVSYIIITVLYVLAGTPPTESEEWLKYLAQHTIEWWAILGLSVLTDFLFIIVSWSLYNVLQKINKNAMLAGTGFLILFVILDLNITWPNYSSLITLSSKYTTAIDNAQRMNFVASANYAFEILSSGLFAVYVILVPSLGIFIIALVMLKGAFSKIAAILGVATGILGTISVIGPFFITGLRMLAILTSVLTIGWVLVGGYKLLKLGKSGSISLIKSE